MAGPTPPIIYFADELACFANGCSDEPILGSVGFIFVCCLSECGGDGVGFVLPQAKKVKNN
jgi:hypothetical protein